MPRFLLHHRSLPSQALHEFGRLTNTMILDPFLGSNSFLALSMIFVEARIVDVIPYLLVGGLGVSPLLINQRTSMLGS